MALRGSFAPSARTIVSIMVPIAPPLEFVRDPQHNERESGRKRAAFGIDHHHDHSAKECAAYQYAETAKRLIPQAYHDDQLYHRKANKVVGHVSVCEQCCDRFASRELAYGTEKKNNADNGEEAVFDSLDGVSIHV